MIGADVKARSSLTDLAPVSIGQPEVQDDQRRLLGRGAVEPLSARRSLADARHGRCQTRFVRDDESAARRR